jgi:uncharacterized DUF497 family protein
MNDEVELEWDETKRQQTLKERGLDFSLAALVLSDPDMVQYIDNRKNYNEIRYIAYGLVYGEILKLCYTWRGKKIRVISIHKIHKKEKEKYYGKDN